MTNEISVKVTCPNCGQKVKKKTTFHTKDYIGDWDKIVSDFDVEEFHCSCGETFLGAETPQSEKVEKFIHVLKEFKAQGKFDFSENGVKIKMGFSDIWKLLKEAKHFKGDIV
ncbi:MAG: hypothetical protein PVF58_17010 [Candidatus Methanofastidiosia archaeon]|jgi:hypothetical protein